MTKQIIYFAGVILLMMAAALVVSAQDISPAMNVTINNTTLNNTTLNNTTINATIPLVNVTMNETAPVAENASIVVTANETLPMENVTLPPVESAENVTEAVVTEAVVTEVATNVTAPEVIEAPPVVNETATAVVSAPPLVPAEGRLGKMETEPAQTVMLGMKAKPTFVVGSGLNNSEIVSVGATKARATYTVGAAAAKSTVGL